MYVCVIINDWLLKELSKMKMRNGTNVSYLMRYLPTAPTHMECKEWKLLEVIGLGMLPVIYCTHLKSTIIT